MNEEASKPTTAHLYGIDPGSSKPWIGFYAKVDLIDQKITNGPKFCSWSRHQLNGLLREIDESTSEGSVTLVSLDVPLSMPSHFLPEYISQDNCQYPFNVEPFTIRPCEAALRKKPSVFDNKLRHINLISAIGTLCGWSSPFKRSGNIPFQDMAACEGVSVMIYSEAPHQPITRVFLAEALQIIGDERLVLKPVDSGEWKSSMVYIMESHPAVSMAFWAIDGAFDGNLTEIARYKGQLNGDRYQGMNSEKKSALLKARMDKLIAEIDSLASTKHAARFDSHEGCDDRLDSFVGLLNLLDLVKGRGDWFGTARSGYFLTPKLEMLAGQRFSNLWTEAEDRLVNYKTE